MTATLKEYAAELTAIVLMALLFVAVWFFVKATDQSFPQEKYNGAYVWCESQPDVESCRWGAFVALSPALNK